MPKNSLLHVLVTFVLVVIGVGCGETVAEIDLHDPVVPVASRRLVADGQDAVSIARARLDDASVELKEVEAWQWDIVNTDSWPPDAGAKSALRKFATARLDYAKVEHNFAKAKLALALAKYELTTAQTAIRHDLATYEMKPIRDRTEEARKKVGAIKGERESKRKELDEVTAEWWKAYGQFAKGGGETREFYTNFGRSR